MTGLQIFLLTWGILVFTDLCRWLYGSIRHSFFKWMFTSIIGNAFWSVLALAVIKFIQWLFI